MMEDIDFEPFLNREGSIKRDLDKLLTGHKGKFLWRKSEKGSETPFKLRKKDNGRVSLFLLKDDIEDSGFNFLCFFFCHPLKRPFCKNSNEFRNSVSISLDPFKLRKQLIVSVELLSKFNSLNINIERKDTNATHCELVLNKDESGNFYDLDNDVLRVLQRSSGINPQEQNEDFINKVFEFCKKCISEYAIKNICTNLKSDVNNPEIKKAIYDDRTLISVLKCSFDISDDELSSYLDQNLTLMQVLGSDYPSPEG